MMEALNKPVQLLWFERDLNEEWTIGWPLSEKWTDNGLPYWHLNWNWFTDFNDSFICQTKWR